MKPIFMALVGAPGSAKSTFAKQYQDECNVEVFSSDAYREKLLGDFSDQSNNEAVFKALYTDLRAALISGKNCIMDATNCSCKSRLKILEQIRGIDCVKIAAVMAADPETCIKRDEKREKPVGEEVVKKFVRSFTFPQLWEGWDKIYVQGYDTDFPPKLNQRARDIMLSQEKNFNQLTPHHKWTLLGHTTKLMELCGDDPILYNAAIAHDFGKTIPWGWEEREEEGVRRYPNHANIGTYYLLQNLEIFEGNSWEDIYEILFYVNYHMEARRWMDSDKAKDKWIARVGEERFWKMQKFIEFDELASGNNEDGYHAEIREKIKAGYYVTHPEELVPEDYIEEPAEEEKQGETESEQEVGKEGCN